MILPLFFAIAIAGDWTGTSTCTNLKLAPACHDEVAIYHFTTVSENTVSLVAEKIVDGKPEYMGEFDMTIEGSRLTHEMVDGQGRGVLWEFNVDGDHISGTAKMLPGGVFRKVDVKRKP